MKRLLAAALTVCMLFAACSKEETQPVTPPEDIAPAAPTQEELVAEVDRGTITDGVYTNAWAGISLTVPEGMTALTEAEMKAILGDGNTQLSGGDESAKEAMDKYVEASYVPLFMINNVDEAGKMKIQFIAEIKKSDKSEEEYLAQTVEQINSTALGYEFEDTTEELKLGQKVYTKITGKIPAQNAEISYYVRKIDTGYLVLSVGYTADKKQAADDWLAAIV